jgi:hypothetical protein
MIAFIILIGLCITVMLLCLIDCLLYDSKHPETSLPDHTKDVQEGITWIVSEEGRHDVLFDNRFEAYHYHNKRAKINSAVFIYSNIS